ncbi:hypothetical protein QJS04_geneDACA001784 [Acorus gramineus]|uniref:DUF676 domain-containing protein n=1 Tax=Acorus gramineus TaxID=55184 RepID=A0AAV9BIE7_ACOGR|nr:hypothetical protein QJS04_geneDACA001784 [Acorus gramineus]
MFRRLRLLIGGLNGRAGGGGGGRLYPPPLTPDASAPPPRRAADMLETAHEVAIYIHRFHNLDLFQQGWYQIKISMSWEDGGHGSTGTPSRVVQYEVPGSASDEVLGVWRIDDADHSFSTQPFRIKYARQDVLLSVMISFNLVLAKDESPSTSAVLLKFELLYAPVLESSIELQASLDPLPAAVHEFRIPPKALLGLHTYCPVHFDSFHSVLVDLSIHMVHLRAGTYTAQRASSGYNMVEDMAGEINNGPSQSSAQRMHMTSKAIGIVKSLIDSRDVLCEELQKLSKVLNKNIEDLSDTDLNLGGKKSVGSSLMPILSTFDAGASGTRMVERQLPGDSQNGLEKSNGNMYFENDILLQSLSMEELLDAFHSVGNQLSLLWNAFLKFHRANRKMILEYLKEAWANDRKTEWSIWMVHSKIDIPHRYLRSGVDEPSHHSVLARVSLPRRFSPDTAQNVMTRADLHRKSISQMKINNRAIQDMHIFSDPSRVPVILVEQNAMNLPLRSISCDSALTSLDPKDSPGHEFRPVPKSFGATPQRNSRVLKVVVFVHGFQGHHLDLRLVRNQWLLIDPGTDCLMSETNEEKTSGDFREMGNRLAEEVTAFLKKKMDKLSRSGGYRDIKLSFVGHSIGNIIIRSALTERVMEPFLKNLYTYMSISGPHLGYLYSSNSLFNSGLWLLKKLKNAQCIHQLTLTDDPDLYNTFFYKLCKQKTLEYFKNIILLSSPQDGYVPYHSARIDLCQASSYDYSMKGQVFTEMLNNCLDQIRAPSSERRTFMRCDVNFDTSSQAKNLNTIIGRAAHIEFLETDLFARFIMWSFSELFR